MPTFPPIRLGLVGLNFGRHIVDRLTRSSELPIHLLKLCDLDRDKAETLAAPHGLAVADNLDALLADPEIEAIGLYTGPNGRAELLQRIIAAGKHVMTTKPFELDPAAALAVLHQARRLGRVLHLNSPNPRPLGEMAIIKQWLAEGAIGRPTLGYASVWAYYGATPADGSWYDDPARCPVAPIFRLGIYPLNNLLTIFGTPETVQVTHARVETSRPTPDNACLTIRFADGAIVTIQASFVVGGVDYYKNELTIAGTQGVIYYNAGPKPRTEPARPRVVLSTQDRLVEQEVTQCSGDYDWEFFARRVRGLEDHDETTPEQLVAALRVVQAMALAEQTGQAVRLDHLER